MKVNNMYLGASPEIFRRARLLRKNMTKAEKLLWNELKDRKLGGYKFRAQHPILKFVLDFYCHSCKLGIEIDGEVHNSKPQSLYDEDRTDNLNNYNIKVIRFKNEDIYYNIDSVKKKILDECNKRK